MCTIIETQKSLDKFWQIYNYISVNIPLVIFVFLFILLQTLIIINLGISIGHEYFKF
jgi:hypothetical protein